MLDALAILLATTVIGIAVKLTVAWLAEASRMPEPELKLRPRGTAQQRGRSKASRKEMAIRPSSEMYLESKNQRAA